MSLLGGYDLDVDRNQDHVAVVIGLRDTAKLADSFLLYNGNSCGSGILLRLSSSTSCGWISRTADLMDVKDSREGFAAR